MHILFPIFKFVTIGVAYIFFKIITLGKFPKDIEASLEMETLFSISGFLLTTAFIVIFIIK